MRYKNSIQKIILVMVVLTSMAACRPTDSSQATNLPSTQAANGVYQTLTVDTLADILTNRPDDYTIVNVHIPYAGEIKGTDANIAYNDINALTSALPDKNAPIILYCRSGRMSKEASDALLKLGYTRIWDVEGGMNAWKASGRTLINE